MSTANDTPAAAPPASVVERALAWAAAGYHVFPTIGKTPRVDHWDDVSTIDPSVIRKWWRRHPSALPGVDCAKSAVVAIDLDMDDGKNGWATWAELAGNQYTPETPGQSTQSGGWHYIYAADPDRPVKNSQGTQGLGLGIDTRGAGGYFVAYADTPPDKGDLVPVPEWVAEQLAAPGNRPERAPGAPGELTPGSGARLADIRSPWTVEAADREVTEWLAKITAAPAGEGNATLNAAALRIGHFVPGLLTESDAVTRIIEAYEVRRAESDRGDLEDDRDATIRSGLAAGMAEPYEVMPQEPVDNSSPSPTAGTIGRNAVVRRKRWLWEKRVPLRLFTLVGGWAKSGKTTATLDVLAAVTRGKLPGELYGTPRDIIIVAEEDSWDEDLIPRLKAAGADLYRVHHVDVFPTDAHTRRLLDERIVEWDAAAVLLDPVVRIVPEGKNAAIQTDVRRCLQPLVAIARERNCAVIGILHNRKAAGENAQQKLSESMAWTAVARSILICTKGKGDHAGHFFLSNPDNNGAADQPTLKFRIGLVRVGTDPEDETVVHAPKIKWEGESERTWDDLENAAKPARTATTPASWALKRVMRNGRVTLAEARKMFPDASYDGLRKALDRSALDKHPTEHGVYVPPSARPDSP